MYWGGYKTFVHASPEREFLDTVFPNAIPFQYSYFPLQYFNESVDALFCPNCEHLLLNAL